MIWWSPHQKYCPCRLTIMDLESSLLSLSTTSIFRKSQRINQLCFSIENDAARMRLVFCYCSFMSSALIENCGSWRSDFGKASKCLVFWASVDDLLLGIFYNFHIPQQRTFLGSRTMVLHAYNWPSVVVAYWFSNTVVWDLYKARIRQEFRHFNMLDIIRIYESRRPFP